MGSSESYQQGFSVAQQLVSVAIGLTVGLFVSAALGAFLSKCPIDSRADWRPVVHPFGSKRRGAGLFSL